MGASVNTFLTQLFADQHTEILKLWLSTLKAKSGAVLKIHNEDVLKNMLTGILEKLELFYKNHAASDSPYMKEIQEVLTNLSSDVAVVGAAPSEVAHFVSTLKSSLLAVILKGRAPAETKIQATAAVSEVLDDLSALTFDKFLELRQSVIKEQQHAIAEMEVPVVKIWERILMMPIISMLDSNRTQRVMESLLGEIEKNQARVAILDISGIPIVDSLVAKHLIQTSNSIKLMGSECIITGIRPKISQTMVNLGIDLSNIITRTTLAEGLRAAFKIVDDHS